MEAALLDFQYSLIELFQSDRVFFFISLLKSAFDRHQGHHVDHIEHGPSEDFQRPESV